MEVTPARGIRKDLYAYKGEIVNFEAFDFANVKIIRDSRSHKLHLMQYYTELYINASNPDLVNDK